MSGTISAAQKAAFLATYGPQAKSAGQTLGVDPNLIYAQWATESGYGTNSQALAGNVAGIMPGGTAATYASPADFEQAYVGVIQRNDPQAVGAGSDASKFVSGLQAGNYFGSDSAANYQTNISGIAATNPVGTMSGTPDLGTQSVLMGGAVGGDGTGTLGGAPAQTLAGTQAPVTTPSNVAAGASSLINATWEVVSRGVLLFCGFVIVLVALIALLLQSKTVQTSASSLGRVTKLAKV